VHWYGQAVFLKPLVRGQVNICEIWPPLKASVLLTGYVQPWFIDLHVNMLSVYKPKWNLAKNYYNTVLNS